MSNASQLTAPQERLLLWSLAAIQFTHIVDFMVMMPLGPQLTKLFHLSDAQFGVLVSAYSLAAGASGLLASLVIDRFDRLKALLMLYAGFTVATLACGLADTYANLMLARIAAGVFGGVLGALVQTIVGDAIPFERRGAAMGIIMSAFSLSTVAGVPASLWIASQWGWHLPFIVIAAASAAVWLAVWRTVPALPGHAQGPSSTTAWQRLHGVVANPNHWRAFGLSALLMMGSFSIIPYITIYTTANLRLTQEQVPLIYLLGGVATFFSARLWGRLSDRWGKVPTFRILSVLALLPMLGLTHLTSPSLWLLLLTTTAFFIFVSGRMVPGMALLTAAPAPHLRGGFMSVNSAVQSAAMGLAAWAGGALISRAPDGSVVGYERTGWLALATTVLVVWGVGRVRLHTAPSHQTTMR